MQIEIDKFNLEYILKKLGYEVEAEFKFCPTRKFRADWKEKGVKPKVTMWAIRAAVTGRTFGADMVGILDVIAE